MEVHQIGSEFYFPYFQNFGNVTRYYSEHDFYFTLDGDWLTEHRSQVMPSELRWTKERREE